jgi:hypothetical protein
MISILLVFGCFRHNNVEVEVPTIASSSGRKGDGAPAVFGTSQAGFLCYVRTDLGKSLDLHNGSTANWLSAGVAG